MFYRNSPYGKMTPKMLKEADANHKKFTKAAIKSLHILDKE